MKRGDKTARAATGRRAGGSAAGGERPGEPSGGRFVAEASAPRRGLGERLRSLRKVLADFATRVGTATAPLRAAAEPALERMRAALAVVSPLGWTLLGGAVLFTILGARLGWREFSYLAAALTVLLVVACLFALGRTRLGVEFEVAPQRVVVGDSSAARFGVRNEARTPLLPLGLELPVGGSVARFTLPPLPPAGGFEDVVVVPTLTRGVVVLGPVTTQRGDPFGVIRREVSWTEPVELLVHPRTVALEPLGAGLLRDLEGRTTNDISMSDLAFHTLRDYVPGDDRRYIHWRSSAKVSGTSAGDRFLVRQFLDTRRSHVAVVTDVNQDSYRSKDEFELAISVGASIVVRALADEMDVTIVCGEHAAVQPPPHVALDTYSRADLDGWALAPATGRLNRLAPDVSVVILVTGPLCAFEELLHARAFFPREVSMLAIRVEEGGHISFQEMAGITVVGIGSLADLPRVMAGGQSA